MFPKRTQETIIIITRTT